VKSQIPKNSECGFKKGLTPLWFRGDLGKGYDTIKGDREHKYLLYTYIVELLG